MNDIHSRIKTLRLKLGLSMEALGKAVGVSWQTVQQWERENGTAPKRDRLQKVADELKTTKQYLLDGDQINSSSPALQEPASPPYLAGKRGEHDLIKQLHELAQQINADGLRELVGFARCLTGTHPITKAKPRSSA